MHGASVRSEKLTPEWPVDGSGASERVSGFGFRVSGFGVPSSVNLGSSSNTFAPGLLTNAPVIRASPRLDEATSLNEAELARVSVFEFRVSGFGLRVSDSGFRVQGQLSHNADPWPRRCRVSGSEFRLSGFRAFGVGFGTHHQRIGWLRLFCRLFQGSGFRA